MARFNLKIKPNQVIMLAAVAIAALVLFNCMSGKSMYGTSYYTAPEPSNDEPMIGDEDEDDEDEAPVDGSVPQEVNACALQAGGSGLSAALLPKETATQEDFGEFAPDEVLANQNYLDPRNQVGFPETVGGALRNANQQVRSEPPNPRGAVSIFNTSTIEPDQMRPPFEIGSGLA